MLFSKTCTLLLAVGVSFTSSLPWDRVDSPAAAAAEGGVATALLLQDQGGDDPRPDNPLPETMTLEDELPSDMVVADTNGNEGSLFDGDYMLSKSQALALIGEEATKELENAGFVFRHKKGRSGRDLSILDNVVNGIGLWTNRTEDGRLRVPISISTSGNTFSPSQISVIKLGMDMIEETGVVKFVERTTESDFIDFFKTQGGPCWSNGPGLFLDSEEGSNIIGLSTNCFLPGIIAHEILHALGFVHEQSRTDRDEHVIINEENIVENGYAQKAYTKLQTDSLGTPYDFGSIMHYQQRTFRKSKGLKTFDVRGELPPDIVFIGQRSRLSHGDAQRLRYLYQCASGPRTAAEYEAEPCTEDCPCWNGALETCNSDSECQGDLQCSSHVVEPEEGCTDLPVPDDKTGKFTACPDLDYDGDDACARPMASEFCRNFCSLPCPYKPEPVMPTKMCLPPPCFFGQWNPRQQQCLCTGGDFGFSPGYCRDDAGSCTVPKKFDDLTREFYCGDQPPRPDGCALDSDCDMLNKGTIQHVCLGEECVPKPDCVHGEWNFGAKECKCTGADNGVQGFCKDDNGACTLAKKYDAMNREFYCDDEGEDVVVPLDCKHGNWNRSESKCVCFGAEGANGFCLDSEGTCTVTRLFDFSAWKYFCPENGQRRLRLRGEAI